MILAAMTLAALCAVHSHANAQTTQPAANLISNGSFELGRQFWAMDKGEGTVAKFEVNNAQAADGEYSALVSVDAVGSWGMQFGQFVPAGTRDHTYTFAAMVRGVDKAVKLNLHIERNAKPYDRVARTEAVAVTKDSWTELHVTFKVDKDFNEGWFAYVACSEPNCRFRVDGMRLYEGPYVAFSDLKKQAVADAGVILYDTGMTSDAEMEPAVIEKKTGWTPVIEDKLDHAFKGDAVFVNNRLAVAMRRKAGGAEVYSIGDGGAVRRCTLRPVAGAAGERVGFKTLVNNPSEVKVEATYKGKDSNALTIGMGLRLGAPYVGVQGSESVSAVRMEAPCRFAVMPDFFADDIVIDANELVVSKVQLPGDNFLMHMVGDGGAIVMAVWAKREADIGVHLADGVAGRIITASEIPCGPKDKAWVAVLEGKGIWHCRDVDVKEAGKTVKLDWRAPMPAMWRVDWRRDDGLDDSWEMIVQRPGGEFAKTKLAGSDDTIPADRKRWTTVLGTFPYPCWIDKEGVGNLQPLKSEAVRFQGPAIVYPLGRTAQTPLGAYTVVDVARATLGLGPCEYILDLEGQQSQNKGRATCANRDTLDPIYKDGKQKEKKADIEKSLKEVMVFIRFIRERIEGYASFSHEIAAYIEGQKKSHPELAKELDELSAAAALVDKRLARRRDKIKTPDDAQAIVDAFRAEGLDDTGPDAMEKCKKFTAAIVEIGSNQDELAGECRWAVKILRQRAGLMLAADERLAEVVREIRDRSQKVLRTPAGHEGARH